MSPQYKRNPFLNTNKYQRQIICSVLIPAVLTCVVCLLTIVYIHYVSSHIVFYSHVDFNRPEVYIPWFLDLSRFNAMIPWLLFLVAVLMFSAILWSFDFSNKLVGPYERVLREIDEVLAGKGKRPVILRRGDDMFQDLIKRVNQLIEKLPS